MKKEIRIADEFFSATSIDEPAQPNKKRTRSESDAIGVILGTARKEKTRRTSRRRRPKVEKTTSPKAESSSMDKMITRAVCLPFVFARSAMDCWTSLIRNAMDD
jgi:hypothetical protein